MRAVSPRIALWIIFFATAFFVISAQLGLATLNVTRSVKLTAGINTYIEPYVLPEKILNAGMLGFSNLMANYYWLAAIQYFGSGDPSGTYQRMPELLQAVTTLDPKFSYPYTFGLLILPDQGFADQAIALGKKGLQNAPDSWEIPYYLGTIYDHYKKDPANAGAMFNLAASKPGVPPAAKLLAGIYYGRAGERATAIAIWQVAAESSDNQYTRERAKAYLQHYAIIEWYEAQAKVFKTKFGRYPNNLDELKTAGFVAEFPADPVPIPLAIDPKTGVVSEVLEK